MHVIATAGHVDHGKSTLLQALTGSDPDRLDEEQRRGMSIELGYCWTHLRGAGDVAFVDVPGHERFVSTMLAGVGPVPAVLFVVAADDPWMPQAAEHLGALDALGVGAAVVAVTRTDLADPGPAMARVRQQIRATTLRGAPVVPVSARTGEGLPQLGQALSTMLTQLPTRSPAADIRLWVDRAFRVEGAGVVVTGTLQEGTIRVGDELQHGSGPRFRVRGMEALGRAREQVCGVARVALNLTGKGVDQLGRGSALLTPGRWLSTSTVDVRLSCPKGARDLPEQLILHIGASRLGCHLRPLDETTARLRLDRPLPLRPGDRALVRDPGNRAALGIQVLDPVPAALGRRGDAARRADQLSRHPGIPDLSWEVGARGPVDASFLALLGVDAHARTVGVVRLGSTLLSTSDVVTLRSRIVDVVTEDARRVPLTLGLTPTALARQLGLDRAELVEALIEPPLYLTRGRVTLRSPRRVPPSLERPLAVLRQDLGKDPYAAPSLDRLRELGLDARAVAALHISGHLLRVGDGVVLLPGAEHAAVTVLAELPQPFTTSEARQALGTSRRVVLPLLAYLDHQGITRRLPDDRRTLARGPGGLAEGMRGGKELTSPA